MKLLGCGMIMTACFMAALQYISSKKRSINDLKDVSLALSELGAELSASLLPLPTAVDKLKSRALGTARIFYENVSDKMNEIGTKEFSRLWQTAAEESLATLRKSELDAVCRLGSVLGRYGIEEQEREIEKCIAELDASRKRETDKLRHDAKMYVGLASCFGILLMIILC